MNKILKELSDCINYDQPNNYKCYLLLTFDDGMYGGKALLEIHYSNRKVSALIWKSTIKNLFINSICNECKYRKIINISVAFNTLRTHYLLDLTTGLVANNDYDDIVEFKLVFGEDGVEAKLFKADDKTLAELRYEIGE